MKNRILDLLIALTLLTGLRQAVAQGTAFTYQGQLDVNGAPADGSYDLSFNLYTNSSGGTAIVGPVTNLATEVSNGLFNTTINFGADVFTGTSNWLQIGVRTNGNGAFTTLTPRQEITPTPYALFASNAGLAATADSANSVAAANVNGTLALAQLPSAVLTNGQTGVNLTGAFTGNGANVTNVDAVALNGLGAANFWQLNGNTVSAGQFLGSANNEAVEIHVNGLRALQLQPDTSGTGAPNVIGGSPINFVQAGVVGATIGGGGGTNFGGKSYSNSVSAVFATVGGGLSNTASGAAAFVGGGGYDGINVQGNTASGAASVVGGGLNNQATNAWATIGGGFGNLAGDVITTVAGGENNHSTVNGAAIGGGFGNTSSGEDAVVGGGNNNQATNAWATIGGGFGNLAGDVITTVAGGENNHSTLNGAAIGGGFGNISSGTDSVVGGGNGNQANNSYATVSGGQLNIVGGYNATVGGGEQNQATQNYATVGGGAGNTASGVGSYIGGGGYDGTNTGVNTASGAVSVVGGGLRNKAINSYATVPGGQNNVAGGQYSFAAGFNAQATHNGAFVWADGQDNPFGSTTTNQFNVRANGGVVFVTSGAGMTLDGQYVLTGSSSANGGGLTNLNAAQLNGNATLTNLTLMGALSLPSSVTIDSGAGLFMYSDQSGDFFAGPRAGNVSTTGQENTALGYEALKSLTSGSNNTAVGGYALQFNTVGLNNIALGNYALQSNISGSSNTVVGSYALATATEFENNNTAIGYQALGFLGLDFGGPSSGTGNIAIGSLAGANYKESESSNIVIGNLGDIGENNTIRIGAGQTTAYIAGVINGNGGGLTNLNAANLTGGSLPDTVLPANVALLNGSPVFTTSVSVNTGSLPAAASLSVVGGRTGAGNSFDFPVVLFQNTNTSANNGPALRVVNSSGTNNYGALCVSASVVPGSDNGLIASFGNASAFVAWITNDGTIYSKGLALTSDRNAKENFKVLDHKTILAKVVALPVTEWNYKNDAPDKKHIGPVAQDFQAAFGLDGDDDKHISVVDEGGVALAAIQGLNQKLEEQRTENAELKREVAELKEMVEKLADRK